MTKTHKGTEILLLAVEVWLSIRLPKIEDWEGVPIEYMAVLESILMSDPGEFRLMGLSSDFKDLKTIGSLAYIKPFGTVKIEMVDVDLHDSGSKALVGVMLWIDFMPVHRWIHERMNLELILLASEYGFCSDDSDRISEAFREAGLPATVKEYVAKYGKLP